MSSAIYIALEREIPDFDPFVNGKSLSKAERQLSRIAEQHGVTPLMDFFSINPDEAAEFMEELDGEIDMPEMQDEAWYTADEGLKTITKLIDSIGADPQLLKNTDELLKELFEWKRVLERAQAEGIRWHAAVDF